MRDCKMMCLGCGEYLFDLHGRGFYLPYCRKCKRHRRNLLQVERNHTMNTCRKQIHKPKLSRARTEILI